MQYRSLGSSGLKVSVLGLGTNQFGGKVDLETAKDILHAALDAGINLIDTADAYQEGHSEEYIGKALKGKRSQALVATKVYNPMGPGPNDRGASRQHLLAAVEASLRRLNTDAIDLYQIHSWDDQSPIEETLRTLEDLVRFGKVRYIGASNFSAWQLVWANALAERFGWTKFASIQPHYHLLERNIEAEMIPACKYFGIGILPYFPLAGGFLTGKYHQGQPPPPGSRGESSKYVQRYMTVENYAKLEKLEAFARERSHSLTDLAHAWLMAQPMVSSVISGATRVEHITEKLSAVDWVLTEDDLTTLNEM
jgi:aryl-alcohol dehydrogenase-like predicted oxidoreductase